MKKTLFIITGSSKGLGRALVDILVRDSQHQVIGISRSGYTVKQENYTDLQIDLSNSEILTDRIGEVFPQGAFKKIVLINNAGWIGEVGPLGKLEPKGLEKIQLINVVAPAILMNAFVNNYGRLDADKLVINISSGAAGKNMDGWAGYSSTKAALNRMTEIAQEESQLHGFGIRYFALSPGIIDTDMQDAIRASSKEDFSKVEVFKDYKESQQLSSPDEVAEKVVYLIDHPEAFSGVLQDVREF